MPDRGIALLWRSFYRGNGAGREHLPGNYKTRMGNRAAMVAPSDESRCRTMTPERWAEIKEVLAPLLEMPAAERPSYLDGVCAGNVALRREVDLLLENERDVSSKFMNQAAFSEVVEAVLPAEKNPWIGRRVGAYQIVEQIGAGGMGEVYRAFRADDQYRKEVALKVVRAGHDSKFVIARFRNERQILASLEHSDMP